MQARDLQRRARTQAWTARPQLTLGQSPNFSVLASSSAMRSGSEMVSGAGFSSRMGGGAVDTAMLDVSSPSDAVILI